MKTLFVAIVSCLLAGSAFGAVSLHGSRSALMEQNLMAQREGLSHITHTRQLKIFEKKKLLVPLRSGTAVKIDRRLLREYSYARPETRLFVRRLSRDFARKFHKPLQINSAVRTVDYQKQLRRKNRNAARATTGLLQSSHTTGATIDIAKKGMSRTELNWMRERLIRLERAGYIEATEEHRQPVFHVMVFDRRRCLHQKGR